MFDIHSRRWNVVAIEADDRILSLWLQPTETNVSIYGRLEYKCPTLRRRPTVWAGRCRVACSPFCSFLRVRNYGRMRQVYATILPPLFPAPQITRFIWKASKEGCRYGLPPMKTGEKYLVTPLVANAFGSGAAHQGPRLPFPSCPILRRSSI